MSSSIRKGIYFAIMTALISGISIFINKYAVGSIKPPVVFTSLKNVGVGLLIIGILFAGRKGDQIKNLRKKQILQLFFIGVIGGSIPFYLFFTGLSVTPAINAALIQKTLVLWVGLLAVPLLKEKMSLKQILGVILLFSGNFVIGGFTSFELSRGELMIWTATIMWAIEYVLAKRLLRSVDPDIVVAARMGFGSIILLGVAAISAPDALSKSLSLNGTQALWMIASITLLCGYVMTWYRALRYAPATTVTAILVASTFITNILSAIFVTHTWTGLLALQFVLMATGIGLIWFSARKETVLTPQIVQAETTAN